MSHEAAVAGFSALMSNPLYAAMPATARAAIEARGRLRRLPAGSQLFRKGEPGDGAYALLSGALRYSTVSPSGRQAVLNILEPGKWLGDLSTLDGQGRTLDCEAVLDSLVMHLPATDFLALFDTVPPFARMLVLIQAERIRKLLAWNEALTKLNAEGRLAERLLIFAQSHGRSDDDGIALDVRLTQELLAELIGTTRQRVNQILNRWQDEGLIEVAGRNVVIRDARALKAMVDLA